MSERSIAGDDGTVASTTVALSMTDQARRLAAWVGARVAIGEIPQVGAKRFAPHRGRVATVLRTHFAGVYVQRDPTPGSGCMVLGRSVNSRL